MDRLASGPSPGRVPSSALARCHGLHFLVQPERKWCGVVVGKPLQPTGAGISQIGSHKLRDVIAFPTGTETALITSECTLRVRINL